MSPSTFDDFLVERTRPREEADFARSRIPGFGAFQAYSEATSANMTTNNTFGRLEGATTMSIPAITLSQPGNAPAIPYNEKLNDFDHTFSCEQPTMSTNISGYLIITIEGAYSLNITLSATGSLNKNLFGHVADLKTGIFNGSYGQDFFDGELRLGENGHFSLTWTHPFEGRIVGWKTEDNKFEGVYARGEQPVSEEKEDENDCQGKGKHEEQALTGEYDTGVQNDSGIEFGGYNNGAPADDVGDFAGYDVAAEDDGIVALSRFEDHGTDNPAQQPNLPQIAWWNRDDNFASIDLAKPFPLVGRVEAQPGTLPQCQYDGDTTEEESTGDTTEDEAPVGPKQRFPCDVPGCSATFAYKHDVGRHRTVSSL